jgi:hypothetical protein
LPEPGRSWRTTTSDGGFAEEWWDARVDLRKRYDLATYVAEELTAPEG